MKKWILLTVLLFVVTGIAQAIPNPSAWYCILQGYKYEIRTDEHGNQYGVCVFPDGSECSGWAYYCKCEPDACFPGNFSCHWPCKEMRCKEAGECVLVSTCCEGLDEIYPAHIFDANCNKLELVGWLFLCSDCGNGFCEDWESRCNCPEDCAQPSIIYVDADANGLNDGSSWADAFNDLQDALDFALFGDEIRVAEGTYKPDQGIGITPGDREATFQLINGVTLKGGYSGFGEPDPHARDVELYETILSGDLDGNDIDVNDLWYLWNEPSRAENSYHVVTDNGTNETAALDGFTIAGGNANGIYNTHERLGGGMYTDSGGATVMNCTFSGNSAGHNGGGMYNSSSVLSLINCTFQANAAKDSGGMEVRTSVLTLTNCTFRGNTASFGRGGMGIYDSNAILTDCAFSGNKAMCIVGGLASIDSNVTLTNCLFIENSVPWPAGMGCGGAGGIAIGGGKVIVTDCIFSGNSARWGGGMVSDPDSLILTNCIFSGNFAYSNGGGMYNISQGIPTILTNCTFSGNSAVYGGGGIYHEYASSVKLANCILWNNTALNGPQVEMVNKSVVEIYHSCIGGGQAGIYDPYQGLIWGPGNIDLDPCFSEPGYWEDPCNTPDTPWDDVWIDGDYHLLPSSACIDAGDPNYVVEPNETDLDGKPRVIGGRIDMGAYEYSPPVLAEVRIVPHTISLGSRGKWIAAFLWLPEDYKVAVIDPNTIFLEGEIEPERFWLAEDNQVAIAKFSREEIQSILDIGEVELTITGQFREGTLFEGSDVIRVIDKGGGKN